jgi:hypothetical protein
MKRSIYLNCLIVLGMVALAGCQTTGYEPVSETLPSLNVSFTDAAWTGNKLPDGQHCSKFGGNGATPPMRVAGIPAGVNAIIVEFNDESFARLSYDGGHGTIGFWVSGGQADLVSVPGGTDKMPSGAFVEKRNRGTGLGYLPPCSGGKGNTYSAVVKAVYKAKGEGEKSKLYAEGYIKLGTY